MTSAPTKPKPPRLRRSLWAALAFILLLIGWWELSVPRDAAAPATAALPAGPQLPEGAQVAVFSGGCFWCVEADFDKIPGVISTTSGYTGGKTVNPTYDEVSRHTTGHAEAVQVVFDPAKVSYQSLLAYFWHTIDPTVLDRQFCDHGTPYRTAVFATSPGQLALAQASKTALELNKPFTGSVVTHIEIASDFYPAEIEHQDYYLKNPVRYEYYRSSCGRDARLRQLWGDLAGKTAHALP
jgi:peptide-methionine (S)-S-oxide reductase